MAAANSSAAQKFSPVQKIIATIKSYLWTKQIKLHDFNYQLSTNWLSILLLFIMAIRLLDQSFLQNTEKIHCVSKTSQLFPSFLSVKDSADVEMNSKCWVSGTFLNRKLLEFGDKDKAKMTHPGLNWNFQNQNNAEERMDQDYYGSRFWIYLGILVLIADLPHRIWKIRDRDLHRFLPVLQKSTTIDRVTAFLATQNKNGDLGLKHLSCKLLATLTPLFQWLVLSYYLTNGLFSTYGIDSLIYHLNFFRDDLILHNPGDVLFPTKVNCRQQQVQVQESAVAVMKIEPGQEQDVFKVGICDLALNFWPRWTFFLYWWILVIVFTANFFSLLKSTLFAICPKLRAWVVKKYVVHHKICVQNVELARKNYVANANLQQQRQQCSRSTVIRVHLSFGDFIVLTLLKLNLDQIAFQEFLDELLERPNQIVELRRTPIFTTQQSGEIRPKVTSGSQQSNQQNQNGVTAPSAPTTIGAPLATGGVPKATPTTATMVTTATDSSSTKEASDPSTAPAAKAMAPETTVNNNRNNNWVINLENPPQTDDADWNDASEGENGDSPYIPASRNTNFAQPDEE